MDLVELASHVCPAGRFLDALSIEPLEPAIGIGLQHSSKAGQVCLRALAFAIWGVTEEHGGRLGAGGGPVIPHVSP